MGYVRIVLVIVLNVVMHLHVHNVRLVSILMVVIVIFVRMVVQYVHQVRYVNNAINHSIFKEGIVSYVLVHWVDVLFVVVVQYVYNVLVIII